MATDLNVSYLKIPLKSPIVVGACPMTLEPESVRQMICCGAGAVVLPSIFQEQIAYRDESQSRYNGGPDQYLTSIQEMKRLACIPVIASMNGYCDGAWLEYARRIEVNGADAIELNLQPTISNPAQRSEEIEEQLCEMVRKVCAKVSIPVAVKLSHRFTSIANLAYRLQLLGAAGVVLFAHEPKWEVAIDRLQWTSHWELTPVDSLGATVTGVIHARLGGLDLSIAASGGVRTAEDAIKAMIAGADVVMITSEIYRSGPEAISKMVHGIERLVETLGFHSLAQFQQARLMPETRSKQATRFDCIDPITRTTTYHDPTPVVERQSGDRYGHQD